MKTLFNIKKDEKKYKYKIGIGKFGSSIKFNKKSWTAIGGDNEAPLLFKTLINKNPNIKFYLISKTSLDNLSEIELNKIFPQKNVEIVWKNFEKKLYENKEYLYVFDYFKRNNCKLNGALLYNGISGTSNIPDKILQLDDSEKFTKPLSVFRKYSAPLIYYLNESNIKWLSLVPDPRYFPIEGRDLMNMPVKTLSQWNGSKETKSLLGYDTIERKVNRLEATYDHIEKVNLIEKSKLKFNLNEKRGDKLVIILNEGGVLNKSGIKRGPLLDEWILNNNMKNVEIYGQWKTEKYKNDPRFKGPLHMDKFPELFKRLKYTFIIPIEKEWTTSKIWEMIHVGVIPFLHPYYDSQKNIENLPEFLRLKTPSDLIKKIKYLENNNDKYVKLFNLLQDLLKPEYFSGDFLNDIIINNFNKYFTGSENE